MKHPDPPPPPARAWRTPEIEELSNLYVVHPVSDFLARRFVDWGWSPDLVSFLGLISAWCGAVCFYFYQYTWPALLGFVFMVGWHVFDGADGQVARLSGRSSEWGRMIDGLCDHLGFGGVYVALALAGMYEYGPWIWALALAAGLSHVIQAGALEFQRDMYDCWVHGRSDKCVPTLHELGRRRTSAGGIRRILGALHYVYIRLQYRFAEVDSRLTDMDPGPDRFAALYAQHNLSSVSRWHLLSANKRTIAVAVFCGLQLPVYFFVYELLVLNALLYWLRVRQRRINNTLATTVSARGAKAASGSV